MLSDVEARAAALHGVLRWPFGVMLVAAFCSFQAGADGSAGTLALGSPTVEDGLYVFPVVLSGTGNVATLDFTVAYDPEVFAPVTAYAGAQALRADKQVMANMPEPGVYRVVMLGLNQTSVGAGEVAQIGLRPLGSPEGWTDLDVVDTTLASWEGPEIASNGVGTRVSFDGPADEPDATEASEDEPEESEAPDSEAPLLKKPTGAVALARSEAQWLPARVASAWREAKGEDTSESSPVGTTQTAPSEAAEPVESPAMAADSARPIETETEEQTDFAPPEAAVTTVEHNNAGTYVADRQEVPPATGGASPEGETRGGRRWSFGVAALGLAALLFGLVKLFQR